MSDLVSADDLLLMMMMNLLFILRTCLFCTFTSRLLLKLWTCSSLRTLHHKLQLGDFSSVPALRCERVCGRLRLITSQARARKS